MQRAIDIVVMVVCVIDCTCCDRCVVLNCGQDPTYLVKKHHPRHIATLPGLRYARSMIAAHQWWPRFLPETRWLR